MRHHAEHDTFHYVNKLRNEHSDPVLQTRNGISCISYVENDSLLQRLRDAIVGGIGAHEGGGTVQGSERLPFDVGARELYDRIVANIGIIYEQATGDTRHPDDPEGMLTRWYQAHIDAVSKGAIAPDAAADIEHRVKGWADAAEAYFLPRTMVPLDAPCPECGNRHAYEKATGDRIPAVVIEYQETGIDEFGNVCARCRFCGFDQWNGKTGIRALIGAIESLERHVKDAITAISR